MDDQNARNPRALCLRTELAVEVDASIYELESILRAAYRLTDRGYLFLERDLNLDDRVTVFIAAKSSSVDAAALVGEFSNELIDQQLRTVLSREAGPVRELIVAQAFAEGNLLDPEREDGDYRSDPHGIG